MGASSIRLVEGVGRLVKSESAVTSVIRLAKISDAFGALWRSGQVAQSSRPEPARASSKDDGRRLSSRCESVSAVRSSAKQTNRTQGSVLSFPLFRPFKVCRPPAETNVLRTRREAPQGAAISTVRIPCVGDVAQLGEHLLCKQGVGGSSPLIS